MCSTVIGFVALLGQCHLKIIFLHQGILLIDSLGTQHLQGVQGGTSLGERTLVLGRSRIAGKVVVMRATEDRFQVWIVEENEDRTASLSPAGFSTPHLDLAKVWAEEFNDAEIEEPMDAWAIVRRTGEDAPKVHQN